MWRRDQHRNIDTVLAGNLADMVFTDPPYNVAYEGYTEEKLTIQGDRMKPEDFDRFLRATFSNYRDSVKTGHRFIFPMHLRCSVNSKMQLRQPV